MIALCSMWDYNYHRKGLALIQSLRLRLPNFMLCVLALDDYVYKYFEKHPQRGVVAVSLPNIETHDLLIAKRDRNWTEYIWTLGPHLTLFAFSLFDIGSIAYIDADCFLFHDLAPLYDEVGAAPCAITPHRYTPKLVNKLKQAGIYNVGWVYFSRDGLECLYDWRNDCVNWCYWQPQPDGRFADQGYLNHWPERYGAHVVRHLGANLGPWNQEQYSYSINGNGLMVSDGRRIDQVLFYHFHGFSKESRTNYALHPMVARHIYEPYEALCNSNTL